ncbi:hypothetical protein VTO42DRAFT_4397 [Malbranchea cinnamomea]
MTSRLLSNDEFFSALSALLSSQSSSARGSIFLTQKRLPATSTSTEPTSSNSSDSPALSSPSPPSILIRATNGKHKSAKTKISTVVAPGDLERFYVRYAEVCKGGMVGLKKRDRSAKKKAKGKKEKKSA